MVLNDRRSLGLVLWPICLLPSARAISTLKREGGQPGGFQSNGSNQNGQDGSDDNGNNGQGKGKENGHSETHQPGHSTYSTADGGSPTDPTAAGDGSSSSTTLASAGSGNTNSTSPSSNTQTTTTSIGSAFSSESTSSTSSAFTDDASSDAQATSSISKDNGPSSSPSGDLAALSTSSSQSASATSSPDSAPPEGVPLPSVTSTQSAVGANSQSHHVNTGVIAGSVIGATVFLALVASGIFILFRRRRRHFAPSAEFMTETPASYPGSLPPMSARTFTASRGNSFSGNSFNSTSNLVGNYGSYSSGQYAGLGLRGSGGQDTTLPPTFSSGNYNFAFPEKRGAPS